MSNTYVIHDARLVDDAETATLPSGDTVCTIRLADNPPHQKDEKRPPRFVKGKVFGKLAEAAAKLSKGDVITAAGNLGLEAYQDKEGNKRTSDVMRVAEFRVHKSETFYGREGAPAGEDRPAEKSGSKAKGRKTDENPFA